MTRLTRCAALSGLAGLLLAGCATQPPRSPVADVQSAWRARQESLSGIDVWEIKGKLAVQTFERGGQVNLLWRRDERDHRISLYGPLGGGRVVLTRTEAGATLRDSHKRTYEADTPEELLYRVAGWQVPFAELQHWVLGVPAPGAPYEHALDEWGRLATLTQSGWRIRFSEYRDFDGFELPSKFSLTALPDNPVRVAHGPGDDGQVRVKAVIKHWAMPATEIDTRGPGQHNTRSSRDRVDVMRSAARVTAP